MLEYLERVKVNRKFQEACLRYQTSPQCAASSFAKSIETMLSESNDNAGRYMLILRALRTYDYVESFAHLAIQDLDSGTLRRNH